jgi:diguanylate cyclase (GGDEF)-like protein
MSEIGNSTAENPHVSQPETPAPSLYEKVIDDSVAEGIGMWEYGNKELQNSFSEAFNEADELLTLIKEGKLSDDKFKVLYARNAVNRELGATATNQESLTRFSSQEAEERAQKIAQEIEDLKQRAETAEGIAESATKQIYEDPMTGLFNKEAFKRDLEKEFASAKRLGKTLSIASIDGNGMKEVNDTFSHQVGDIYIEELAKLIKSGIRDIDSAYRLGGDEFALLLQDATPEEVAAISERINGSVNDSLLRKVQERVREKLGQGEQLNTKVLEYATPFTASFGIASLTSGDVLTPDSLLQMSDVALYNAKKERLLDAENKLGKVVSYTPGMHMPEKDAA